MLTVEEIKKLQIEINVANEELKQLDSEMEDNANKIDYLSLEYARTYDTLEGCLTIEEKLSSLKLRKHINDMNIYFYDLLGKKLSLMEEILKKQDILDKYIKDTLPEKIDFVVKIVENVAKSPKICAIVRQNGDYIIDRDCDDNTVGFFDLDRREIHICVKNIAKDILVMDREAMIEVTKKVANCFYREYRHVAQYKMILMYCKSYEKANDFILKSKEYNYNENPLEIDAFKYAEHGRFIKISDKNDTL